LPARRGEVAAVECILGTKRLDVFQFGSEWKHQLHRDFLVDPVVLLNASSEYFIGFRNSAKILRKNADSPPLCED
jgi:hypothetical protein